ncbi:UDP-N-acetylmuramate--L-alanine ligase [Sulfurospirillum arcachonense]|uniref:UDP-N-acetylmuramate--L-alanine ligase n=1 Tax=Sulfurospirillum arcachonense TaxID=57666 RepID=UPI000467FDE9|nr:UDP-N-acetylmuramate--L-alanine ligase [Sulfurospirillum arcachonense]
MKSIHFVGIGGIGLSALARYLKKENYIVSGSDIRETKITKCLVSEGIDVSVPHSEKNIKEQDLIIYSAAVKDDNIELIEARKRGIMTLSRKDALPLILKEKRVFSVCGAHGKSTTSAMLASMVDGSVIIGAESKQFDTNMYYRNSNNIIFEADESDSSFLNSNPYIAIVTNAEPEHMEYYNYDYEKFYDAYKTFLKSATIRVINAEDEFLATLDDMDAIRLYPSRDITELKTIIKNGEPFTSFILKDLGRFEVWGIGSHIAIDASLAILASINEIDLETTREKIKNYRGIKKRFDILSSKEGYALIDDYGHHPTEIKATIASAKIYADLLNIDKITAIWQPHKYSRTVDNLEGFVDCFKGIDKLVIMPVWSAGEVKREIDFEKEFQKYSPQFINSLKRVGDFINLDSATKLDSGLVIGFGAGDITYQLRGA